MQEGEGEETKNFIKTDWVYFYSAQWMDPGWRDEYFDTLEMAL